VTKRWNAAKMTKINMRVASQTMTIVRGPRCASYQAARRLIQDPRFQAAGEWASEFSEMLVDEERK
jgi:hypothetical protein